MGRFYVYVHFKEWIKLELFLLVAATEMMSPDHFYADVCLMTAIVLFDALFNATKGTCKSVKVMKCGHDELRLQSAYFSVKEDTETEREKENVTFV